MFGRSFIVWLTYSYQCVTLFVVVFILAGAKIKLNCLWTFQKIVFSKYFHNGLGFYCNSNRFKILSNKLERIPYGLPYQHIELINLLDNKITMLTERNMFDLVKMEKLTYLNLKNNRIVFVDPYYFHRMENLEFLILPGNKMVRVDYDFWFLFFKD